MRAQATSSIAIISGDVIGSQNLLGAFPRKVCDDFAAKFKDRLAYGPTLAGADHLELQGESLRVVFAAGRRHTAHLDAFILSVRLFLDMFLLRQELYDAVSDLSTYYEPEGLPLSALSRKLRDASKSMGELLEDLRTQGFPSLALGLHSGQLENESDMETFHPIHVLTQRHQEAARDVRCPSRIVLSEAFMLGLLADLLQKGTRIAYPEATTSMFEQALSHSSNAQYSVDKKSSESADLVLTSFSSTNAQEVLPFDLPMRIMPPKVAEGDILGRICELLELRRLRELPIKGGMLPSAWAVEWRTDSLDIQEAAPALHAGLTELLANRRRINSSDEPHLIYQAGSTPGHGFIVEKVLSVSPFGQVSLVRPADEPQAIAVLKSIYNRELRNTQPVAIPRECQPAAKELARWKDGEVDHVVHEYTPGYTALEIIEHNPGGVGELWIYRWLDNILKLLIPAQALRPPIVHRDIKPENIWITSEKEAYLIDWTSAAVEGCDVNDSPGTVSYAAPEQFEGRWSTRSDIYALGASMYHLATGKAPPSALERQHGVPMKPVSDKPLAELIAKFMDLDPLKRLSPTQVTRSTVETAARSTTQRLTRRMAALKPPPSRPAKHLSAKGKSLRQKVVCVICDHNFEPELHATGKTQCPSCLTTFTPK